MTWSSISWGLRPIQSVKTITWFSDRSGIASTGMVISARTPAIPTASAARITRKRLRIDHSMIASIIARLRPRVPTCPLGMPEGRMSSAPPDAMTRIGGHETGRSS